MIERGTFVPSGRDFIGMGAERRLTLLLLPYCTDKASFQNGLWGPFKASPIFFGVGGLSRRRNSICETTGLNLLNMEKYLQDMSSGSSSFCIDSSWPWITPVNFESTLFHHRYLIYNRLFYIDSNDLQMFLNLCWKLTTGWWIWYQISDIKDCKILIIH